MRTCLVAVFSLCLATTLFADARVEISHADRSSGALPPIELRHGERLEIVISSTNRACFQYNAVAVEEPPPPGGATRALDDRVSFDIVHDEQTAAYEVRATKKDAAACAGVDLESKSWQIAVRTSWRVATTGSLVATGLVRREFYLEPAVRTLPGGGEESGFSVRRDEDAEDALEAEGGVFANLYSTDPKLRGWVPVSLGVSLDLDRPVLMLGTGLRFAKVFVTTGIAAGNRNRLPTGMDLGDFTPRSDALATLPDQRALSWFLSVSLPVWTADVPRLQSLVKQPAPQEP